MTPSPSRSTLEVVRAEIQALQWTRTHHGRLRDDEQAQLRVLFTAERTLLDRRDAEVTPVA